MVLVLFDIDGTLITSGGTGRRAIARALSDYCDVEVDMSKVPLGGRTDPAIVRDILRLSGVKEERMSELIPTCLELYADELKRSILPENVTVLPGVSSLLNRLHSHPDYSLALITGNLQKTAYMKLGAGYLDTFFPCGGFGSDSEFRNHLPEIARDRSALHYGRSFSPSKTIVIGDTEHDITCSRHFGAWAVAVSTGMNKHDVLASHEPDLLVPSLGDEDTIWSFFQSVLNA